jgi:zinc protease
MKTLFTGLLSAACFSLLALPPAAAQTAKPKAKPASPKTPVAKTAAALAAPKEKPPVGSAPRDFKLPPRQDFTLANGLQARLVPFGEVPKMTLLITIQAGNVHEPDGQVGISDLLSRLLKEGTPSRPAAVLAEQVARMGGSLSIGNGSDETYVRADCLSEYAPQLVELLADVVQHPSLPASELPRLKADFKRQLNLMRARPSFQAEMKMREAVYAGHPYGRPLPTDAQIDALTLEQAKAFYANEYGAKRTAIFAAGKFDAAALRQAIETGWNSWPAGPEPHIIAAKALTTPTVLTQDRPSAPQSTLVIGLPVIDPTNPDYIKLRVTNSLLGGSFGSRITRNIREDKGYTYSPYSYLDTNYHSGLWIEEADVTTKDTYNSLHEIVKEVERLQTTPPSAEELKGIQNYETGMFVLRNSTPGGIVSQLSTMHLQGLPDTYLTEQVQNINAVTPAQVSATARKYVRPEAMTTVVVGDQKVIAPQLKQYKAEQKKPL